VYKRRRLAHFEKFFRLASTKLLTIIRTFSRLTPAEVQEKEEQLSSFNN
jgi:hypothetical protein